MSLKNNINKDDIIIYDEEYKKDITKNKLNLLGYNIGDLFNMPSLHGNLKFNYDYKKKLINQAIGISKLYKNSILFYYFENKPKTEEVPNISRIENSVKKYFELNKDNFKDILDIVIDKNNLCIHLRSGDKICNDDFKKIIIEQYKKFQKIIILCGIHLDETYNNNNEKVNNLLNDLNSILSANKNIYVYLDKPDIHICLMYMASNLLVHQGGFSAIGSIVCTGNVFYTNSFTYVNKIFYKKKVNKKLIKIDS